MKILSYGNTDIGLKRKSNQDSFLVLKELSLFCVADGMGGHKGGDIASQMAVQVLEQYSKGNRTLPTDELLGQASSVINEKIYARSVEDEQLKGMGTTINILAFADNKAFLANIGDSRTYLINSGNLFQLTRDHSLVQEKLYMGIYDREGAKKDPQKNVLIRSVGFEPEVMTDIYQYKVNPNDLFLLCSDGLHGYVSDKDILSIINREITFSADASQEQLENAANALIGQANANGGKDNISVILVYAH